MFNTPLPYCKPVERQSAQAEAAAWLINQMTNGARVLPHKSGLQNMAPPHAQITCLGHGLFHVSLYAESLAITCGQLFMLMLFP